MSDDQTDFMLFAIVALRKVFVLVSPVHMCRMAAFARAQCHKCKIFCTQFTPTSPITNMQCSALQAVLFVADGRKGTIGHDAHSRSHSQGALRCLICS